MRRLKAREYTRVSTPAQAKDDRFSIPTQRRINRQFIEQQGWVYDGEYCDDGKSAHIDNLKHRPGMRQALTEAEQGIYDVLVVTWTDRFWRNVAGATAALQTLEQSGVELASATEHFGTGANGALMRGIMLLFAQHFSDRLSERIHESLVEKFETGHWVGREPYGYDVRGRDLIVNEFEAQGYHLAVQTTLQGSPSLKATSNKLNDAGYIGKRGGFWHPGSMGRMLRSVVYLGYVITRQNGQLERRLGTHPPLIEEGNWRQVQAIIATQARRHGSPSEPYALSGIAHCARCGDRLNGLPASTPLQPCYYCWTRRRGKQYCDSSLYRARDLEELVAGLLDTLVLPLDWRNFVLEQLEQPRPGPTRETLEEEKRRLLLQHQKGYIDDVYLDEHLREIETALGELTAPDVQGALYAGEYLTQPLGKLWRAFERREKRAMAATLFDSLYFDGTFASPVLARVAWRPEIEQVLRCLQLQ